MNENITSKFENKLLSPLTLLYKFVLNLPGLLIPLYFLFVKSDLEGLSEILIFSLLFFISLPPLILNYFYFRYTLNDNEIVIRSGIFAKQERLISFSRIQNINLSQNFFHRLLGITKFEIETAGDLKTEGVLEYISVRDASVLQDIIKSSDLKISNPINTTTPNSFIENSQEIYKMPFNRLLVFGMFKFRPWVLFIGFWLFSTLQQFQIIKSDEFDLIEKNLSQIEKLNHIELIQFILLGSIIILVSSWLIGILITLNFTWNYKIIKENAKIIISKGLLNTQKVSINLKKIQSIEIVTNPLKKLFGFYSLGIQTAGLGEGNGYEGTVPIAKYDELIDLTGDIFPVHFPDEYFPISRKAIRRAFFRYMLIFTFPILILAYFLSWWILSILVLLPTLYFLAQLSWEYRSYAHSKDKIFIKEGFIFQKMKIIPISKIQTLHIRQSYLQRLVSLSSLYIDTAGSSIFNDAVISDIDINDANKLLEMIILEFNKNKN